jgi:hypothetical protein
MWGGAAGVLLVLACGPDQKVEGSGSQAGAAGKGGESATVAGGGAQSGGADDEAGGQPTAGEPATVSAGSGGGGSGGKAGSGGAGGRTPIDDGPQAEGDKVDLLIAVDNSISMAEKQRLFAKSIPELLERLVSPYCLDSHGDVVLHPATPTELCPSGSQREFAPLRDLHVGVITSSLGPHGASGAAGDVCQLSTDDDHAHLLPLVRSGIPSYDGRGFLKWDPDALATPPGESDVQAFAASLETMILGAGEHGCGYEAQLESVYRFLVDPEPPLTVERDSATLQTKKVGIDLELLTERNSFLRPDSSVAVLMLTDENDCSIQDQGYGWLVSKSSAMFRANSVCLTSPNDPCCQSCGESVTKTGCSSLSSDSECVKGPMLPSADDSLNLRCFEQKRRFGFDLLYPTARYVEGFGGVTVPNRAGELVPNPLFHRGLVDRDPSLFTLVVVAGVPWQDLATKSSLTSETLEYLTAAGLNDDHRWPIILGDPSTATPPSDPFMRESTAPRSGENPFIHVSITPSTSLDPQANPINGHEQQASASDLEYACTFELPEPIVCDQAARDAHQGCDCFAEDSSLNRPMCNPPGGGAAATTQYYGKAYPGLRPLAVAKELGRRAVLGSVCARNTQDEAGPDYGYRPVFGALGRRIAETLNK